MLDFLVFLYFCCCDLSSLALLQNYFCNILLISNLYNGNSFGYAVFSILSYSMYCYGGTCDYFLSIHHLVSLYNVLVVSCFFQLSGVQIRTSESADVPGSTSW